MSEEEQTTLHLIRSAAMQEFLKKGFKSASLRNIVKIAGVTTGAFYGYYDSKEDLFESLVSEHYNFLLNCFCKHRKNLQKSRQRNSLITLPLLPANVCMKCSCTPMII